MFARFVLACDGRPVAAHADDGFFVFVCFLVFETKLVSHKNLKFKTNEIRRSKKIAILNLFVNEF